MQPSPFEGGGTGASETLLPIRLHVVTFQKDRSLDIHSRENRKNSYRRLN
jgi:hypothetical protein